MYYRYIERNMTGEGEIWSVFIKIPSNDKEQAKFEALKRLTVLSDNSEEDDSYYFEGNDDASIKEYTQKEVDLLLEENAFSTANYMSAYMTGEIKESVVAMSAELDSETPWYEVQELLYKMQPIKKD